MKKCVKRTEVLKQKARVFALHVLKLSQHLRKKKEAVLAAQFLRSGTSVGANLAEGRYTYTRGNYISKHSIALAEAGEALYWIELFIDGGFIKQNSEFADIHAECCEIIAILEKVVKDARRRKAKEEREKAGRAKPRHNSRNDQSQGVEML